MKIVKYILLTLFLASLCVSDFAWPADQICDELFVITHSEVDPDGNAYWSIRVTPFMQENGSDQMCVRFGQCVLALIDSAPQMGAVEIVNPPDEWVPSKWRWIESTRATILAGELDENEWIAERD